MASDNSSLAWGKKSISSIIESQTLTGLATSLTVTFSFVLLMIPTAIVSNMDPEDMGTFPNYLYVNILHLIVPVLMGLLFNFLYYAGNPDLRKATWNSFWQQRNRIL